MTTSRGLALEPSGGATMPREQVLAVMARAGYPPAEIEEAAAALPEQVDFRADHLVLARFSLSAGQLMDRLGSSP